MNRSQESPEEAAERAAFMSLLAEGILAEAEGREATPQAAEALAISPTTLWRKMTRLGISLDSR